MPGPYEALSADALERQMQETQAREDFWLQQQGFEQYKTPRTVEEAKAAGDIGGATWTDIDWHQRLASSIQGEIGRRQQAGITGQEAFDSPIAAERHGPSGRTYDIAGLESQLQGVQGALERISSPYTSVTGYRKSTERLEQEAQQKEFAEKDLARYDIESNILMADLKRMEDQMAYTQQQQEFQQEQWDVWRETQKATEGDYKRQQESIAKSLADYSEVMGGYAKRQKEMQEGKIPVSDATKQEHKEAWNRFKEQRATIGQVITGDTPEKAIAQGSTAEAALRSFNETWNARIDAEKHGAMMQEAGILQGGIGQMYGMGQAPYMPQYQMVTPQMGQYGAQIPGIAGTSPFQYSPNLAGLQGVNLASQPYQFNAQLAMQQQQLEAERSQASGARRSGLMQAGIGALGSIGGAALGGWIGGLGGAAAGGVVGIGASRTWKPSFSPY